MKTDVMVSEKMSKAEIIDLVTEIVKDDVGWHLLRVRVTETDNGRH